MNEPRQRVARPLLAGLVVLGALAVSCGYDVGGSVRTAQTAVVVAQTALPAVQTSLPAIQATAQTGATQVAAALSDPQAINAQLQMLFAGATVAVKPTPADAKGSAVTQLEITGTDTRGTLTQMDAATRQATAGAALQLLAQYYPKATISLTLVGSKSESLLSGSKAPDEAPVFQ